MLSAAQLRLRLVQAYTARRTSLGRRGALRPDGTGQVLICSNGALFVGPTGTVHVIDVALLRAWLQLPARRRVTLGQPEVSATGSARWVRFQHGVLVATARPQPS